MFSYGLLHGVTASTTLAAIPVEAYPEASSTNWVTVPAGKVSGDLSGFPMRIDLARMSAQFWSSVSTDGGNIRVTNTQDRALAIDLVAFDRTTKSGELFVRVDLKAASDNIFMVKTVDGELAYDVDAPRGRHAVWGDYASVHIMNSLADRSGHGRTMVLDGTASYDGWLRLTGSGNGRVNGIPLLTSWTMGVTQMPTRVSDNAAMLSYTPAVSVTTQRASLVLRGGNPYGIWNSTDGWLFDYGPNPKIGDRLRFHHTQNTTVNRKIYRNGVLANTDIGCAQRPTGTNPVLFIGAESTTYGERYRGALNYAYLREGELSAEWLRAEYLSWETDTFFDVSFTPHVGTVSKYTIVSLKPNAVGVISKYTIFKEV